MQNYRFPHPSLPRVDLFPELFANAIPLAIVCYAFVVSNGKLYAKRHKYKIDATQVKDRCTIERQLKIMIAIDAVHVSFF